MPWSNNPAYDVKDSVARSDDVYEVIFDQWGFRSLADPLGDYTNLQWPPTKLDTPHPNGPTEVSIPSALAGIAIGPQSTVDRCWVGFNLGKTQTSPSPVPLLTDRLRRLSVDSPILFTQKGNPDTKDTPSTPGNPITTLATKGSLYIYAMADEFGAGVPISFEFPRLQDTTILPQTYRPSSGGAPIPFEGNVDGKILLPKLHLYLYLKAPIFHGPIKRFPLQVQGTVGAITPIDPNAERIIAQIPTFGRKRIHVMMMSTSKADFRIGAFRAIGQVAALQEQPVDQALAVPANTPTILGPCAEAGDADYTNLYATLDKAGEVLFQFTAYD